MAYEIGDPNHIAVHNALVADVQAQDDRFAVDVVLPDTAKLGDTGHVSDHNLLAAALQAIADAPTPGTPPLIATGGTESTYVGDGTNGVLGQTYKVHTFTADGTLTVTQGGEVRLLLVGGGRNSDANADGGDVIDVTTTIGAGTITARVGRYSDTQANVYTQFGTLAVAGGYGSNAYGASRKGPSPSDAGIWSNITGTNVEYGGARQRFTSASRGVGAQGGGLGEGVVVVRYKVEA